MTPNPTHSHEILAGGTGQMMLVNTSRGEIVRRVSTTMSDAADRKMEHVGPLVKLAPLQRGILAAAVSGAVSVLDPRIGFKTASNISSAQAHTGGLNGADAKGNIVCTWGWTHM